MFNGSLDVPAFVAVVKHTLFLLVAQTYTVAEILAAAGNVNEVVLLVAITGNDVCPVRIIIIFILIHPLRTPVTPNQFIVGVGQAPISVTIGV